MPALIAIMMFPATASAATMPILTENENQPVGGWSPVELHVAVDEVDVDNASDLPQRRKSIINNDGESESVFTKSVSDIGYNALSDNQKRLYNKIDEEAMAFMNATADTEVYKMHASDGIYDVYVVSQIYFNSYGLSRSQALIAFYAYDYDHPAYYWISNTVWSSNYSIYLGTEKEYASVSERARINALIESGVEEYVSLAENGTDDLDKIAMIHDLIVDHVDYAYNANGKPETAKWAHSVQGIFDEHKHVVCEGYADAFSMLMNYMGIPSYYIVGTASSGGSSGGHAWNAVSDDNGATYMYMDLTWDDCDEKGYYYSYFGMPASDFEQTHFKDTPNGSGSEWLYEISGNMNNSFEGTYYKKAHLYYDGTDDTGSAADIALTGKLRAARLGSCSSYMSPDKGKLSEIGQALGKESISSYTTKYNGTSYYVYVYKIADSEIDLSGAALSDVFDAYKYTGSAVEPEPTVTLDGVVLIKGRDYSLTYSDNVEINENACVTVTGCGKFSGATSKTFAIAENVHNHLWSKPSYKWADDYSSVTATRTCSEEDCTIENATEEETVDTTSAVTKEAGCETVGETTYTSAAFKNNAFTVQVKTVANIQPKQHAYGAWTNLDENQHKRVCANDPSHVETGNHSWDSGAVTKAATATEDGIRTYNCTVCRAQKMETIPASGSAPSGGGSGSAPSGGGSSGGGSGGGVPSGGGASGGGSSDASGDKAAQDKQAADAAAITIAALPATVTMQDKASIKAALDLYETLTPEQQQLLPADTVKRLNDAVAAVHAAEGIESIPAEVSEMNLSEASAAAEAARKEYDALTPDQKKMLSLESVAALAEAEQTIAAWTDFTENVDSAKALKTNSLKAAAKKHKIAVKWKKTSGAGGYQVQYAAGKKFTKASAKNKTVKSGTKATLKNLKGGKAYYVRVRTYKKVTNKATGKTSTVYGKWTNAKKVKTK